jgi:hypothetical protein
MRQPMTALISLRSVDAQPVSEETEAWPAGNNAPRIARILEAVQALLAEQQELVHRLDELADRDGADAAVERAAHIAHMDRHEEDLRRLLNELDVLTGRAN